MVCLDVVYKATKFGDDRREKIFSPQNTVRVIPFPFLTKNRKFQIYLKMIGSDPLGVLRLLNHEIEAFSKNGDSYSSNLTLSIFEARSVESFIDMCVYGE